MKKRLSHFDAGGAARMVDVGGKAETVRVAVATGAVEMAPATLALVAAGKLGKGDVLGVARLAAVQGLKRTSELIPLCHPVRVTGSDVSLTVDEKASAVRIRAEVSASISTPVRAVTRTSARMVTVPASRSGDTVTSTVSSGSG